MMKQVFTGVLCGGVLVAGVIAIACGSSNSATPAATSSTGAVTVSISDPATCKGPGGPFSHVYVTITDIKANISSTAGDNDAGWTDLTPTLPSQPKQIDLLGQANNQCFLATMGDSLQLQAGRYQQLRIILADNSTNPVNNQCTGSANCVVLSSDGSVHTLELSSESKTGLKIPSGQIASGGFSIGAVQTKDLDIDFNTCASIVRQGNGKFRLKPVLHAGEVTTTSTSINGKILDVATATPVNGQVMVALEQKDTSGIDRMVMTTLAGTDGTFVFCPIPAGSYDVVVVGVRADGVAYQASIVTGVANGQTVGNVPLYAGTTGTLGAVTFAGTVTSQTSSNAGTPADIDLSALEADPATGSTFTIPLLPDAQQSSGVLAIGTAATATCPTGTDCADYTMTLPAGGAYVGAYSTSGSTVVQLAPLATYVLDGFAFVPGSGGVADCSPSELKTQAFALVSSFNVPVPTLAFTQCQ